MSQFRRRVTSSEAMVKASPAMYFESLSQPFSRVCTAVVTGISYARQHYNLAWESPRLVYMAAAM